MTTALLLDADILAFKIASTAQKKFDFGEGLAPSLMVDDWEDVEPRIDRMVEDLKEKLKTELVIVCLSCPTPENWRLSVLPTYKGNRDYSQRPVHLAAVKDYLATTYPSYRRPTLEADDIMGILSTMNGLPPSFLAEHPEFRDVTRKVIVSEDKDMKTIPGWLFNPAKDTRPVLIGPLTADRWHLYQTICGDTTDGYAGCPGAGPDKADDLLNSDFIWRSYEHEFKRGPRKGMKEIRWARLEALPSESIWDKVVALYARYGQTEEDALVQARVARILRASDYDFKNKEVILWTP